MTFRHWKAKMGHYLLLVAIVAVGVGAFNGIRQASRSASANFGLFNQAVSGRSDFLIESPVQRMGPDELSSLRHLGADPDWHLVPVIEGSVTALDGSGQPASQLRLVGLDLLALANLPSLVEDPIEFAEEESTWHEWLGSEREVWIGLAAAEKLGVGEGESVSILASGRVMEMSVRKILEAKDSNLGDDLVLADLPTVQALLSRPGEVNRVEVVLRRTDMREDRPYLEEIRKRLSGGLPAGMILSPTENRAADRSAMTAAFRLNLTILSLIAILVPALNPSGRSQVKEVASPTVPGFCQ